jgi:hypothetical protein
MDKLRDKIEMILRDTLPIQVSTISSLWSGTWNRIDKNEMTDYSKLLVQESWKKLREELNYRCFELVSEIHLDQDYETKFYQLDASFTSRIIQNFGKDPHSRQALLSLYGEEFRKQAIHLEIENFKRSITRYFYNRSEDRHNLYSDFISIFKQLDSLDIDRKRIRKSEYKKFLINSALEYNLYISTIRNSLKAIYYRSYERISILQSQKPDEVDVSLIHASVELSELDTVILALSSGLGTLMATIGLGIVGAEASASAASAAIVTSTAATASTAATVSAAMIAGSVLLGVGVVGTSISIGVMASWSRKSVWKTMAKKVRNSILDHESFKQIYKECQEMLKSSEFPSI